jgi:hypothetical protein
MYEHTQRGTVAIWALGIVTAVAAILFLTAPSALRTRGALLAFGTVALIVCSAAVVFGSLTIRVTDEALAWHFGPGVWHKSVALAEVTDASPTMTSTIEGWGVHLTSRGWLYNVSGFGAVLVTRRDGGRFLLGSDEPEVLTAAIRARLKPAA